VNLPHFLHNLRDFPGCEIDEFEEFYARTLSVSVLECSQCAKLNGATLTTLPPILPYHTFADEFVLCFFG
jgi:hypothetical protein